MISFQYAGKNVRQIYGDLEQIIYVDPKAVIAVLELEDLKVQATAIGDDGLEHSVGTAIWHERCRLLLLRSFVDVLGTADAALEKLGMTVGA